MNITLETLRSTELYSQNHTLYDEVIGDNKALITSDDGFLVYFYVRENADFKKHQEFEFYPIKLEKIHQSIEAITKFNLESKLLKAYDSLLKKTNSLLQKPKITTTDLQRYAEHVKQTENTIYKNDFLRVLERMKMQISDLSRNLPGRALPTIIKTYNVVGNNDSELDDVKDKEVPFLLKRPPMVNSLVLPAEPNSKYSTVWIGFKLGPLMGHGTEEIWKVVKNEWRCSSSKMTWVS